MAITETNISKTAAAIGDNVTVSVTGTINNVSCYCWVINFTGEDKQYSLGSLETQNKMFSREIATSQSTVPINDNHANIKTLTPIVIGYADINTLMQGIYDLETIANLEDNDPDLIYIGPTYKVNFVTNVYMGLRKLHEHWDSPKRIPANSDLDDYTEIGMYYNDKDVDVQTFANCPVTQALCLLVEKNGVGEKGIKQTVTTYHTIPKMYIRSMYTNDLNTPVTNYSSGWKLIHEDTGWKDITLPSGFTHHSSTQKAQYRRVGNTVHLKGAIKNTNALTANTYVQIGSIGDSTCRPIQNVLLVEQGSGINRFLMYIAPNGNIYLNRYGTTSGIQVPSGSWLNIFGSFVVG